VPRITDERRDARREQIIDAARACILDHGLEAVSMEMIIARSGMSTGAVYRYFKGKDQIIAAAVTDAMAGIGATVSSILAQPNPGPPGQLIGKVLSAITEYSRSGVGAAAGVDRMPVAIHGWSYVQTNAELKGAVQATLRALRDQSVPIVRQWQAEGTVAVDAKPEHVAQLIQSIALGFIAERVLTGDAEVEAFAQAVTALAGSPGGQPSERKPRRTRR
jgi:TetR/AcrR family transcriptional regulator, transcriptional repressor of aconitase